MFIHCQVEKKGAELVRDERIYHKFTWKSYMGCGGRIVQLCDKLPKMFLHRISGFCQEIQDRIGTKLKWEMDNNGLLG